MSNKGADMTQPEALELVTIKRSYLLKLIAVNEALRRDAERYRWLRDCDLDEMAAKYWPDGQVPVNEDLDAAIDAAMKGQSCPP